MHTAPPSTARVAVAQIDARSHDLDYNAARVTATLRDARDAGIDLVVLPECALTGYLYDSLEETRANALSLTDERLEAIADLHRNTQLHSVIGFLERDGDVVYNTAALFSPEGLVGTYRKQHLPFLAADRFVTPGQRECTPVFSTAIGNVGIMICFDLRFPECARELALQGSDIIAMPTNWPVASAILADLVVRVRALENLVFLAVSDRNDEEAGVSFIGRSQIISPRGAVLVDARNESGLFSTEVSLSDARVKDIIVEPGTFELPIFAGRRPELYVTITSQ
ncbi:MAG: carbon-nitrogen hydrolase family protein [Mycobacterium sp.]